MGHYQLLVAFCELRHSADSLRLAIGFALDRTKHGPWWERRLTGDGNRKSARACDRDGCTVYMVFARSICILIGALYTTTSEHHKTNACINRCARHESTTPLLCAEYSFQNCLDSRASSCNCL